jgi:hypothetical protein
MVPEHASVVLLTDLPESGLVAGDVGVVVHVYRNGQAYEVEFVRYDGSSNGTVTLAADQVRPAGAKDVPHVRELAA